jgi:WD40 repeat protein
MKVILGFIPLIVLVLMLASCEKPVEGELEQLLNNKQQTAICPRWSYDGSKIYFIYNSGTNSGRLGVYDFATGKDTALNDPWMHGFDISRFSDLMLTNEGGWFWIRKPETWEVVDSSKACEKSSLWIVPPRFSYESENVLYYMYWVESDTVFVNRINREDETDVELFYILSQKTADFAPGPGDTLFAISDTVYNLNSGEKVPLGVRSIQIQWNPADPNELLVVAASDEDLYVFNIQERKLRRIRVGLPEGYKNYVEDARFSPDGKSIVLVGEQYSDGGGPLYLWLYKIEE